MDGGRVEVIHVKGVWERIGLEFAEIVFVTVEIDVIEVFDFVGTEIVCGAADLVDAANGAVADLIHAVARAVEIVEHLVFGRAVEGEVVVRVPREDGKIVVGLVLDQGVVPAVAYQDGCKADQVGTG